MKLKAFDEQEIRGEPRAGVTTSDFDPERASQPATLDPLRKAGRELYRLADRRRVVIRMVFVRLVPIGMATLLAIGAAYWFTGRSGLFNNRLDPEIAMTSHWAAWSRLSCQGEFSRLCMHSILREHGGTCITQEDVWETVHMDQRLDHLLKRPGMLIDCHVDVRGRLPFDLFGAYRWTATLEPVSPDRVKLKEFRRGRDTL